MNDPASTSSSLGPIFAMGSVRLWLGLRALFTGVEKFAGTKIVERPLLDEFGEPDINGTMVEVKAKVYGWAYYHGVPEALYGKLEEEPLIPNFALGIYDALLGPLLLFLGVTTLLGLCIRCSLFAMGLLYSSLTVGLILLQQDAGVAWLAVHLVLVVAGLALAPHHRFFVGRRWSCL